MRPSALRRHVPFAGAVAVVPALAGSTQLSKDLRSTGRRLACQRRARIARQMGPTRDTGQG